MSISRPAPGAHTRLQNNFLGPLEKTLLIWSAERLPPQITPDHLTALSLAAMGGVAVSFAALTVTKWAVLGIVFGLFANWLGDSLDGTVARVRAQERPRYGYYVDHVVDLAGTGMLFAGISCSGAMSPIVAVAVLAGYLLVAAETFLATHATAVFRMSFAGVGPTELRLLLMAGAVKLLDTPWISLGALGTVRLFDVGGVVALAGLAVVFLVSSLRNVSSLYAAEPAARPAHTSAEGA